MNRFFNLLFINIKIKNMGQILERVVAPTPKFFRVLRNIGIVMATVGGVLLAAPVALPTVMVTIGGYLVTEGGVATAVSQITNIADDAIGLKGEGGADGNAP